MRLRRLAIGTASLFLLSGCSEGPTGTPPGTPSVTSTPVTTTKGIPTSPPPIPRPLDASRYRDKPCDLFTDEQVQALGYPPIKRSGVLTNESQCTRHDESNLDLHFSIWYRHDGTDRFAKVHRREESWRSDDAVSITVEGQPAVRLPGTRMCTVLIGLSSTESIEIHFGDPKVDSCDRAVRIAEGVVRNVRG
ncbi:DUF3558 domain-containing protein [Kibdelosporangium persicum]|uniref:DUF3558 domain-containing protein n=1 Tax=Kibdelosporangium persicum TaxID=2698649 RepID=A0ABX2EYY1_9PSEU|nr:DUF3558 family protein [Kibdelosporangium persicum]NRN64094.1 hypothetical protein [Kibdelosporangium persicum]